MEMKAAAIISAYKKGQSINSIAKTFKTYPTSIKRILEKNEIELRHDSRKKGEVYVEDGEKLLEWAKAQGRLVTKSELAKVIKKSRLSPSYFIKYPELGQYVETRTQKSLKIYTNELYDWLKKNNIPYKPNDRSTLEGLAVDALLLGEYSNLAIQISEKPTYVSKKQHEINIKQKLKRAEKVGIRIVFLNKDHFENLDDVKLLLDSLKK